MLSFDIDIDTKDENIKKDYEQYFKETKKDDITKKLLKEFFIVIEPALGI